MLNTTTLENTVLAHRYLYYVEAAPVISDHEYDVLERKALEVVPATSALHQVGSSLPSSYSDAVVRLANQLAGN